MHFRFSSDILKRLGEELNPSPAQGIIELVKNSYDADAINCVVEIKNIDKPGGSVKISDDGIGMTYDDIQNGWFVIGKSPKDIGALTRLGRIPAGSKGLGRLAALRLGKEINLTTIPSSNLSAKFEIPINWSAFDNVDIVEQVDIEVNEYKTKNVKKSGSIVNIKKLHNKINEIEIKKLARGLVMLGDPWGDNPFGFNPTLIAPEFAYLEKMVSSKYFHDADYHLVATLDKDGLASAKVMDWKGNVLFSGNHKDISHKKINYKYNCPQIQFDHWIFILTAATFSSRNSTLIEVRKWLTEFGGVHVYDNGIRVSPYGNPGDDWLDLNLRRAQSPEERPSTNTSIGRVLIQDNTGRFMQKTDRSGFIENPTFHEFKLFAHDSLEWLARRRLEVAEKIRISKRVESAKHSNKSKKVLEKAIESIPKKNKDEVQSAFTRFEKSVKKEVGALKKEVQLYRTLSTAGIIAATFVHETSSNPIKILHQSVNAIMRRGKKHYKERFTFIQKPLESIKSAINTMEVLSSSVLRLLEHEKRRLGRVNIHDIIDEVINTFNPYLVNREVLIVLKFAQGNPYLRGSDASIECIITNFINNSLLAFEEFELNSRKIEIRTIINNKELEIVFSDNGPGIENIGIKTIWLPGQSTRMNGTGLGLTIVRDTVGDLGGTVHAMSHGPLGGATFTIKLPILGS